MKKLDFAARDEPYYVYLPKGQYLFQCWGASGGGAYEGSPGKGRYASGIISLDKGRTFYIYVGKKGTTTNIPQFNYANDNVWYRHGGAATDIRLEKGNNWYDFYSLASRIIVAGGGGAFERINGGNAGGLIGETIVNVSGYRAAEGGTQIRGGSNASWSTYGHGTSGKFGIAGNGYCNDNTQTRCDEGCGGGSGYYGGGGLPYAGSGGGGSSYISGYEGCDSISKESTEDNITHTGSPIHFSGLFFYDPVLKGGNESIISPKGTRTTGNEGDGFARISIISGSLKYATYCFKKPSYLNLFVYTVLIYSN